jgi:hypothetical protein
MYGTPIFSVSQVLTGGNMGIEMLRGFKFGFTAPKAGASAAFNRIDMMFTVICNPVLEVLRWPKVESVVANWTFALSTKEKSTIEKYSE